MQHNDSIQILAECLRNARRVLFITGAGLSADSGLPTYRGIGGLYNDQLTEDRMSIETALSAGVMATRPAITWKYLHQIESACRTARFNRGHEILAQLERDNPGVWVLTQNIDGFHRQAGSQNLIEIHGNLYDLHCTRCAYRTHVEDYSGLTSLPPPCPACSAMLRPAVVLFDENLEPRNVVRLYEQLAIGFDLVFSVGTSSVFPYIIKPVMDAHRRGNLCVEINPEITQVSGLVDYKLIGKAAATLEQLYQHYCRLQTA